MSAFYVSLGCSAAPGQEEGRQKAAIPPIAPSASKHLCDVPPWPSTTSKILSHQVHLALIRAHLDTAFGLGPQAQETC